MTNTSADSSALSNSAAPIDPEWPIYLDQEAASAFLWHTCGVKIAPKTLQKRRVVGARAPGGSPPYRKIFGRVIYERETLKAWGDAQRSKPISSTSELQGRARVSKPIRGKP